MSQPNLNDQDATGHHVAHDHHIVSPRIYLVILFALLVGTDGRRYGRRIWTWDVFNPIVALAIACIEGDAGGAVLHACEVRHETYEADGGSGRFHIPDSGGYDTGGLL